MWSCKTKGILRAFLEESGSWGSEHLLPEPRVPGAGRLAGGWAEGTATGPLTPPACSPYWASLPTGPAEARATLTRTGACLCTRPPSGPKPGFTSLLGLVTPSPQCPLSLLQPHRSSCSLCSHHTPACLGLCISCSVRLAHPFLLSPLILQRSLLTRSEQWNISFHISKQRMSQAPAIAAPTDSELTWVLASSCLPSPTPTQLGWRAKLSPTDTSQVPHDEGWRHRNWATIAHPKVTQAGKGRKE